MSRDVITINPIDTAEYGLQKSAATVLSLQSRDFKNQGFPEIDVNDAVKRHIPVQNCTKGRSAAGRIATIAAANRVC